MMLTIYQHYPRCVLAFLLLLSAIRPFTTAFPESQNPFSAGPPTINARRNKAQQPCKIVLFHNASLDTYSKVSRFPYTPTNCMQQMNLSSTERIILKVRGKVAGVQYDRAGALWFSGVELLRMTTPEPTSAGIVWRVERDVTSYATMFWHPGEVQIQIPNIVNNIYTGIIYLSAQLWIYPRSINLNDNNILLVPNRFASQVMSLTNPPQYADAWTHMAISGNQSKTISISLPTIHQNNVSRAHLDLYASGHGCEEFWYTNPPDAIAKDYGISCGGGSTRLLQVKIDGQIAGIQPPFPVVYTGGINPLLWRPQTGIYSFHIPPYFFDITPFLASLTDGKIHEIAINVIGNSPKGEWNIDPVLVMYDDSVDNTTSTKIVESRSADEKSERYKFIQRGPIVTHTDDKSTDLRSLTGTLMSNVTWVEQMEVELVVERKSIVGTFVTTISKVSSSITNSLLGDTLQATSASFHTSLSSSAYNRIDTLDYPFRVSTDYQDLNHSFLIIADIDMGLEHLVAPYSHDANDIPITMMYQDFIQANATYSRSTDPDRTVYVQQGLSHQQTSVWVDGHPCFARQIVANDGFVTRFQQQDDYPYCRIGLPECFCSVFGTCSPRIVNHTAIDSSYRYQQVGDSNDNLLLVRHPRLVQRPIFEARESEDHITVT